LSVADAKHFVLKTPREMNVGQRYQALMQESKFQLSRQPIFCF
jgi:hypothetical protein